MKELKKDQMKSDLYNQSKLEMGTCNCGSNCSGGGCLHKQTGHSYDVAEKELKELYIQSKKTK